MDDGKTLQRLIGEHTPKEIVQMMNESLKSGDELSEEEMIE